MHLSQMGLDKKDINALKKKHVHTVDDLLKRFPRAYRDYRYIHPVGECLSGEYAAIGATFNSMEVKQGSRMKYLRLNFTSYGLRFRVDFFVGKYAAFLRNKYSALVGKEVVVTGKVTADETYGISVSDAEVTDKNLFVKEIRAVYPKNGTMEESRFRFWLDRAMEMQGEILEEEVRKRAGIGTYVEALKKLHHPDTPDEIEEGQRQMAFYDLLWFELKRKELEGDNPQTTDILLKNTESLNRFIQSLPFPLTALTDEEKENTDETSGGQMDILSKLVSDASTGRRIEAVIEGDVGCGKTAVAAAMSIYAAGSGYQAVIIAPKTVLAKQHAREIGQWCEAAGISCEALIGTPKGAEERKKRKEALRRIRDGETKVIIGTHACFGKDVEYKNIGLLVIDEEQQFGVEQKAALRSKALPGAHYIEMSATPVPRSLALSIYGNREIYRITKKPSGRKRVQTASCSTDAPAMRFMQKQLALGRQCYVVVPMIDENEDDGIDGVAKTAKKYSEYFSPMGYSVVKADGKMKEEEFTENIEMFKSGDADILVATTVIEVGVNVPNATVIVIRNAERFGLSQLHQLRGRVGRREYDSYCVLLTEDRENERVRVMEMTDNGFTIAEKDLLLRGPGDVNGLKQSGQNKFIEEALLYPEIHKRAKEIAGICDDRNRYGLFLKIAYEEHEQYEG